MADLTLQQVNDYENEVNEFNNKSEIWCEDARVAIANNTDIGSNPPTPPPPPPGYPKP